MARYALLIDYDYCTGCHSCEVACQQEHGWEAGMSGMKVIEIVEKLPNDKAYLVFLPLAGKLRARSEEETLTKEMTVEGMICLAKGMNPRILEEYLLSFLAPEKRVSRYR